MDALPDRQFKGVLKSISESGEKRLEWGKATYFEGIVELETGIDAAFMPGMSALIELDS